MQSWIRLTCYCSWYKCKCYILCNNAYLMQCNNLVNNKCYQQVKNDFDNTICLFPSLLKIIGCIQFCWPNSYAFNVYIFNHIIVVITRYDIRAFKKCLPNYQRGDTRLILLMVSYRPNCFNFSFVIWMSKPICCWELFNVV